MDPFSPAPNSLSPKKPNLDRDNLTTERDSSFATMSRRGEEFESSFYNALGT